MHDSNVFAGSICFNKAARARAKTPGLSFLPEREIEREGEGGVFTSRLRFRLLIYFLSKKESVYVVP